MPRNDSRHLLRPSSRLLAALLLSLAFFAGAPSPEAQSLLGSRASLLRQNEEAQAHEFSYLQTTGDVRDFVDRGLLVRIPGNADYWVADVSFPYARPEVKTFLERLSSQYHNACRERLIVTSLTRPADRQPWNASPLSVHPTGMAIDLRRSNRASCRAWLERNLLALEGSDVVEATKERHPPHYHISVFPKPYLQYLAKRGDAPDVEVAESRSSRTSKAVKSSPTSHSRIAKGGGSSSRQTRIAQVRNSHRKVRVGRGDTLWSIAQRHRVSVAAVKRANRIRSNHLTLGQMLAIPAR
jgi:LysM repeat protein